MSSNSIFGPTDPQKKLTVRRLEEGMKAAAAFRAMARSPRGLRAAVRRLLEVEPDALTNPRARGLLLDLVPTRNRAAVISVLRGMRRALARRQ